jgi:hypothetical protein
MSEKKTAGWGNAASRAAQFYAPIGVIAVVYFYVVHDPDALWILFLGVAFLALAVLRATAELAKASYFRVETWEMTNLKGNGNANEYERLLGALNLLNGRIGAEYDTASERIGWMLVSQSFLVAALVTVANNSIIDVESRKLVLHAVIVLGTAIAALIGIGIALTQRHCELMKKDRQAIEVEAAHLGIPPTGIPRTHPVHVFGHFTTRALPCVALAGWVAAWQMIGLGVFDTAIKNPAPPPHAISQPPTRTVTSEPDRAHYELTNSQVIASGQISHSHTFLLDKENGDLWQMSCQKGRHVEFIKVERMNREADRSEISRTASSN